MAAPQVITTASTKKGPVSFPDTPKPHAAGREPLLPDRPSKKPPAKELDVKPGDAIADFSIICNGGMISAHKSILQVKCPYFSRVFRFAGKEASKGEVVMEHISRRTMSYALEYMYTGRYVLPGGVVVPPNDYCNHYRAAFEQSSPLRARITKRKCRYIGKVLAPWHLLPHCRVYMLADYLDMADLKAFARQGVIDVLHVYWNDSSLKLRHAIDLAFTATPENDRGLRDVLVDTMVIHPGLWVDDGDVRRWLDEHPEVLAEVDCT